MHTSWVLAAALALVAAFLAGGVELTWRLGIYLVLPLACIWFSEAMGDYIGSNLGSRPAITRTTPGCFVAFGGWLLLLLPVIIGLITYLSEHG